MAHLDFDEVKHQYTIDGTPVPSVTEICKPLTVDVASQAKPWLRDAAADRGTRIHEYCAEIDMQGGAEGMVFDWDCVGYVNAYLAFLRDYRITQWSAVEYMLCNPQMGVAGTLDRAGIVDRKMALVDLKTGSHIDRALLTAQLTGYQFLWEQSGMEPIDALYGLQLRKNGEYRLISCKPSFLFFDLYKIYQERNRLQCRISS